MPRHRQTFHHYKPSAQPSHFKSTESQSATPSSERSVNTLLTQLRLSTPSETARATPVTTTSLPPSLASLLGTPALPPPRPRTVVGLPRFRRTPGPPPPASWLLPSEESSAASSTVSFGDEPRPQLPGLMRPSRDTLFSLAIDRIVGNWKFHENFDMHYIPQLPVRIKSLMLSRLAERGPIDAGMFRVLFEEGAEEVTHLDLSGSRLGELARFFRSEETVEESWEEEGEEKKKKWSQVTHLSVADPEVIDWRALERILEACPGVTHLVIRGWDMDDGRVRTVAKKSLCLEWLYTGMIEGGLEVWGKEWRGIKEVVVPSGAEQLGKLVREVRKRSGGGWVRFVSESTIRGEYED
ncbi:hypothetical protein BZA77DRAFT_383975 [Pyronema omphalodes]|nr:hypothetical protein BZA77DRAFT_383975 [Pyronema omphalodes]